MWEELKRLVEELQAKAQEYGMNISIYGATNSIAWADMYTDDNNGINIVKYSDGHYDYRRIVDNDTVFHEDETTVKKYMEDLIDASQQTGSEEKVS